MLERACRCGMFQKCFRLGAHSTPRDDDGDELSRAVHASAHVGRRLHVSTNCRAWQPTRRDGAIFMPQAAKALIRAGYLAGAAAAAPSPAHNRHSCPSAAFGNRSLRPLGRQRMSSRSRATSMPTICRTAISSMLSFGHSLEPMAIMPSLCSALPCGHDQPFETMRRDGAGPPSKALKPTRLRHHPSSRQPSPPRQLTGIHSKAEMRKAQEP